MNADMRLIRQAFTLHRSNIKAVCEYVRECGSDRRYRLHVLAGTSDWRSAIVRYRGERYYVTHDYPTDTYEVSTAGHRR